MAGESSGESSPRSANSKASNGHRLLDGAIEWLPPRIAGTMLDRLESKRSWPEAVALVGDTIGATLGASSWRGWILDFGSNLMKPVGWEAVAAPPPPFDTKLAGWLMSSGVRRITWEDARDEPQLCSIVGEVTERGCVLLMMASREPMPPTCLAWVIDQEDRLPSWAGRVLSEFSIGIPSWWSLLEESREQVRRLEDGEKDRKVALACRSLLHDLDNAIFPIRCRLDLLFSPLRSPDELRHLEAVSASIDQLKHLAVELRTRIDGDGDGDVPEPTTLWSWWESMREAIAAALPPSATLVGGFPESLPPIAMPEAALTQAMINLATNAGKAIGSEGAVVVSASETEYRRVRISFSDNGTGIAPESLERIRRGIRDRRSERLKGAGREGRRQGNGLAIVEELVERWGGRVEIESTEGEGTRIGIIVPIASLEEVPDRQAIVEIGDVRRRWMITEMLRSLGVRSIGRGSRGVDGAIGDLARARSTGSADVEAPDAGAFGNAFQKTVRLWVGEGAAADSSKILPWLEAGEDRLAIVIGDAAIANDRIRLLDSRIEDPETLRSLRLWIRESDRMEELRA